MHHSHEVEEKWFKVTLELKTLVHQNQNIDEEQVLDSIFQVVQGLNVNGLNLDIELMEATEIGKGYIATYANGEVEIEVEETK